MKRRELALILLAPAAAAQPAPAGDSDAAAERVKNHSAALSKYVIPMATEPAFAFKA